MSSRRRVPVLCVSAGIFVSEAIGLGMVSVALRSEWKLREGLLARSAELATRLLSVPTTAKPLGPATAVNLAPSIKEPWQPIDGYFATREIGTRLHELAGSKGVELREHESFALDGLARATAGSTVAGESLAAEAIDQVGTQLLESSPAAVLSVRRTGTETESPSGRSFGQRDSEEQFVMDPGLQPADRNRAFVAIQLTFSGTTTVLREFVNRLANLPAAQLLALTAEPMPVRQVPSEERFRRPPQERFVATVAWLGGRISAGGPKRL